MEKVLSLVLCLGLVLGIAGCGSDEDKPKEDKKEEKKVKEPVDLTGTWISIEEGSTHQEAIITADTIEINWVSDEDDTKSIYWIGTYTAPEKYSKEHAWTSTRDVERTKSAILASSDETKDFTYKAGVISYSASAMGSTKTVKLEKRK